VVRRHRGHADGKVGNDAVDRLGALLDAFGALQVELFNALDE